MANGGALRAMWPALLCLQAAAQQWGAAPGTTFGAERSRYDTLVSSGKFVELSPREWAATSTPSAVKGAYTHGTTGHDPTLDWIMTSMERGSGTAIKLAVDGNLSSCALMFVDRYRYLSTNNVPAVLSH